MSDDSLHVEAGELSVEEIIEALRAERRVVVRTEMLGSTYDVTLRRDGDLYYCDTPTTLHKHESEDEMRQCIRNQGYAE